MLYFISKANNFIGVIFVKAVLINDSIRWLSKGNGFLSYDSYTKYICANPRGADDSLGPYYDFVLKEIAQLWSEKTLKDFSSESLFDIDKNIFIDCLNEFIAGGYVEFPLFMVDLCSFVTGSSHCKTRYDIFVGFIKEYSKVLL